MLTGENDGLFGFGRSFHGANARIVFFFGASNGTKLKFKASLNGINVSLDPNEGGIIATDLEEFADGIAFVFSVKASFNNNILSCF